MVDNRRKRLKDLTNPVDSEQGPVVDMHADRRTVRQRARGKQRRLRGTPESSPASGSGGTSGGE